MKITQLLVLTPLLMLFSGYAQAELTLQGSLEEIRELVGPPAEPSMDQKYRSIAINIEHQRRIPAKEAHVYVSIKTEEKGLDNAMEANSEIEAELRKAMVDAGVDPDDIATINFTSSGSSGWFTKRASFYTVASSLKVKVTSNEEMLILAGLIDSFDEVEMGSIQPDTEISEEQKLEVLNEAFEKLKKRVENYEEQLGISLKLKTFAINPDTRGRDANVTTLQPFQVNAAEDVGYLSASTTAGTRITSDLKTIPTALSIAELQINANIRAEYYLIME